MNKIYIFLLFILLPFFNYGQNLERDVMNQIFTAPLNNHKIYPAVSGLSDMNDRLSRFNFSLDDLQGAYGNINIDSSVFISDSVFNIKASIHSKEVDAWSYFIKGGFSEDSVAFLVIPGTGENQSSAIFRNTIGNYQKIADLLELFGDVYIHVKPNQDFLAIHDSVSGMRLNYDGMVGTILNNGGSYSATYLIQAIAQAKYLKGRYKKLVVVGCSQGGLASLIVSLESTPDYSVVASGFSYSYTDNFEWSDFNQIIVEGIWNTYNLNSIKQKIGAQPTNYLFTYGQVEGALYGLEALNDVTKNEFSNVPNVSFRTGPFNHVYSYDLVEEFLVNNHTPSVYLNTDF